MTRQPWFIAMLGVIAALDVASAILMPQVNGSARPPTPAIVAMWILAALTVASAWGLTQGARWPRILLYVTCSLRIVSAVLGLGDHPGHGLIPLGTVGVALSVVVLAVLIRTRGGESPTPDLRPR